ncbi:MAG: preprotein translocase subunit YajC [Pseudoflavonifractor sp.]
MDSTMSMLIMIVPMIAIFYFLLIRPENKKKKAMAKMRSELAAGDQITTIGGIVGTICAVKEDTIVLETGADRVRIEFTKWAISTRGTQTTEEPVVPKDSKKDSKAAAAAEKEVKETKEDKAAKEDKVDQTKD